jgi:anti-anti-sigma factor
MSAITHDDVGQDLRRILISGRLDTEGTDSIASRLIELAGGTQKAVVVDLSHVLFLASIGLGALISSAKAVQRRGGKLALVAEKSSPVMMSLSASGVDKLIPVYRNVPEAEQAALA